jgi:hypothetical protein
LFTELERVRPRDRFHDPRTMRLAILLDLTDEFWTVNYVNDLDPPCHPQGYVANDDWATCRCVREQLLDATGLRPTGKRKLARVVGAVRVTNG